MSTMLKNGYKEDKAAEGPSQKCYNCLNAGHFASHCRAPFCRYCSQINIGHTCVSCPRRQAGKPPVQPTKVKPDQNTRSRMKSTGSTMKTETNCPSVKTKTVYIYEDAKEEQHSDDEDMSTEPSVRYHENVNSRRLWSITRRHA